MGLPHWQWETYDRRPYLLWVPARPQLPARPASGRKQMPSSPTAPLEMPVPAQLIILSPARSPWLPHSCLPSHAPLLPWVRRGHARQGSPSGCPPRLPAGRAQSGLAPRGRQEGLPGGTALPKPLCQGTGHGHASPEVQAGTPWGRSPAAAITYLGPWGPWGSRQAIPALVGGRKIG